MGFQNSVGADPTVLFDSENPDITWDYPDHFHSHTGIIFSEPGAYATTFTFTLNDGSEHSIDVPFLVGGADTAELCQLEWGSGEGGSGGSGSPKNRPQQLAKDINDTSKAIAQLDKTMDKTFKEADTFFNGGKPSDAKNAKEEKNTERSTRASARKETKPQKETGSKEPSAANSATARDRNPAPTLQPTLLKDREIQHSVGRRAARLPPTPRTRRAAPGPITNGMPGKKQRHSVRHL